MVVPWSLVLIFTLFYVFFLVYSRLLTTGSPNGLDLDLTGWYCVYKKKLSRMDIEPPHVTGAPMGWRADYDTQKRIKTEAGRPIEVVIRIRPKVVTGPRTNSSSVKACAKSRKKVCTAVGKGSQNCLEECRNNLNHHLLEKTETSTGKLHLR